VEGLGERQSRVHGLAVAVEEDDGPRDAVGGRELDGANRGPVLRLKREDLRVVRRRRRRAGRSRVEQDAVAEARADAQEDVHPEEGSQEDHDGVPSLRAGRDCHGAR
jgi:hypothetical protein